MQDNLASLLKTAEELKIKGLAEVSWRNENRPGEPQNHPPATAEILDTSSHILHNSSNIFVKTFNNNNNNNSHNLPASNSPNVLMYPKISTPVSLAPPEPMPNQPMHLSPFHQLALQQLQSNQTHQSQSIPQLTPLRIQGTPSNATVTSHENAPPPPFPVKKKRGRPPLDGEFEQYTA